jgi:hypothetical protein
MNATGGSALGQHLQNEVAPPVLFNTWKHHAGALRERIAETRDAAALPGLAAQLAVVGSELMDLYVGALTPVEIGAKVVAELSAAGRLEQDAFRAWVQEGGGYQVVTFAEDGSRWVLRCGPEHDRYVHVHPARYAPQTRRVRANVLKTAVMVLAYVHVHGGDPQHVHLVNRVRTQYLGLSKMRALADDQGLSAVLDVLATP